MSISVCSCLFKHIVLDRIKQFLYLCLDVVDRYSELLMGVTANQNSLIILDISRSNLNTNRDSTHLGL